VAAVPDRETTLVLESIGYDLLVFLAASVVVPPVARFLGVTPILGYLLAGAVLGPNALDLFANSKADLELGDIGILFLLFSEGLEVTSPRLQKLANYLPLGLAQVSLVTGVITATIMSRIPEMIDQMFLKLDPSLLGIGPTEAVVLALILCLSTSAFVFPVLKERGWEEEESGEAATSILLLQDLLVAPLLVILPYIADTAATDYEAIGFLTAKATLGFGAVLWMGSLILQKVFQLVAAAESSETFVALCLLVSAGMGIIAKFFGLTDTAGAFAAGVLLANTNYRAQIQADVLPFKGILLGIFFMDAGSNFDFQLVLEKWPTVLLGSLALLFLKSTTLGAATRVPTWMEPNRLPAADGIRVSLLLAGGGEFAFVVLALAQSLGIVPTELAGIVTAIVLITMGLTPLLGDLAAALSEPFVSLKEEEIARNKGILGLECECPMVAHNAIVVCGFGEVGQNVFRVLAEKKANDLVAPSPLGLQTASLVAFDTNPSLIDNAICTDKTIVLFGNAANAEVIRSSGVTAPSAIFITYEDSGRVHSATARLRAGFPDTPIFARASTRAKIVDLEQAGATEVVVESDELPRSSFALVQGVWSGNLKGAIIDSPEHVRAEAAAAAGISLSEADRIFEVYKSMDQDGTGRVSLTEIESVLERSSQWIASDDEIRELDQWIEGELDGVEFFDAQELCRLYGRAPEFVKRAFGVSRPATESR
jgi:Kef-type K+ transport system membrane component KefB/voltage-gated potassium channel Kch